MRVFKENQRWSVSPFEERIENLLWVMTGAFRPEDLAVFAIRRHGFGSDSGTLSYPEDLDPGEVIPPMGHIVVSIPPYDDARTFFVSESEYLEVLAAYCEAQGLPEERDLVTEFRRDQSIEDNLPVRNAARCIADFQKLLPLLEARGWTRGPEMIRSKGGLAFTTHYDRPLKGLLSITRRSLQTHANENPEWVADHHSLLSALEELLESMD